MSFAAIDLHKREIEAVVLDDHGKPIHRERFPTTRAELERFAKSRLGPTYSVAVEATTNTWPVVAVLRPFVREVVVSNPMRTRAIAEAKIKTDKVDALVLAQLLRSDFLPRVWMPDDDTQSRRQQSAERAALVSDRTRIKNRIHSILHHRMIEAPHGDLFSVANLHWLKQLELDPQARAQLDRQLRLLTQLDAELAALTQDIAEHAYSSPQVKLLMTIPGVDFTVAETLLAALGDITRFRSADKAAAYLGLVPSTRQSGDQCYHGRITKQGSGQARWLLVQAAQHLRENPGPLGVFFRRLRKRKNYNVAVVATARKIVTIAWHMLINNEPYRYATSRATEEKLRRLRVRVTKSKKKTGAKGKPRSATYGSGLQLRKILSLDSIYQDEGLPPIQAPKPGESAMLAREQLADFAAAIRTTHHVPRIKKAKTGSTL
jgi:transposase